MCSDRRLLIPVICDLLIINCINGSNTKQRAVLKGVGGEGVVGAVPQAPAADLHALIAELADVDQNNNLVSGNHEVLYTSSYHLGDTITELTKGTGGSGNFKALKTGRPLQDVFTSLIVFVIF